MPEPTERERDLDVAQMQLDEARDALESGDLLAVLEAVGDVATWIARAEQREQPVAWVEVERAGEDAPTTREVSPGDDVELDFHGKATIRVRGADLGLHAEVVDGGE